VGKTGMAVLAAVILGTGLFGPTWAHARTEPEEPRSVTRAVAVVGTVKAVSADRVVVMRKTRGRAAEWTFVVDARTRIRKGGKGVTAVALMPGDRVHVRYAARAGRTIALDITVMSSTRTGLGTRR
jgi:hypothetical protein